MLMKAISKFHVLYLYFLDIFVFYIPNLVHLLITKNSCFRNVYSSKSNNPEFLMLKFPHSKYDVG